MKTSLGSPAALERRRKLVVWLGLFQELGHIDVKEQVDPLVDLAVTGSLKAYKDKYTLEYSKFYATDETENSKDCAATVAMTTNDGLRSQAEVRYRLVATEDGEVLTQFQDFNWKGLVFGHVCRLRTTAICGSHHASVIGRFRPCERRM